MPQFGEDDGGVRLAGAYRTLLRKLCESETRPGRRVLHAGGPEYEAALTQSARAAERLFQGRLAAAQPIVVPKYYLGGHSVPVPRDAAMFGDRRRIRAYRVYFDDRVEVAERWDDDET